MFEVLVISVFAVIYFTALFGWGHLIEKIFRTRWPFPFTICLGMASWIFFGGIINLAGVANSFVLDSMVLLGLGYSAFTLLRSCNLKKLNNYKNQYLTKDYLERFMPSAVLIVIVFVFLTYTLAFPKAFNFHDDLEKYISHPIRMLATGSLKSDCFDVLGGDTFGGQAFLQGFAVAHFPIGYINTVDTVFAFTLFLMSVLAVALRMRLHFILVPLVVLAPVFINPQYVNISASYTASVLILFLFLGSWLGADPAYISSQWPNTACLGLVYSALVVLKTSFLLPVTIHFVFMLLGFICVSHTWKNVISWATKVVAFGMIFILPWVILYLPNWLVLFTNMNRPINSLLMLDYRYSESATNLFSLNPLSYGFGDTFVHYTFSIIIIGVCSIIFLIQKHPNKVLDKIRRSTAFAACATAPISYFISTVIIAPILFGQEHALRFLCPVIIAAVPTTLIMASTASSGLKNRAKFKNSHLKPTDLILAVITLILIVAFIGSFSERVKQAFHYGSILSFQKLATNPKYIAYNHCALSADTKKIVQKAQQVIPEKEKLVAWTPLALHLDYRRNHIISVSPSGFVNPWMDFPFGKGLDEGIAYFINSEAFYVLWQYRGYAVRSDTWLISESAKPFFRSRTISNRTQQFTNFLSNMSRQNRILYNDGQILVMKLPRSMP